MPRKLFTLAAALSLVVCVTTTLLWDASRDVRGIERQVVRGGVAWLVTCRDGEVRADNSPQREAEAQRVEQEHLRIKQEREERERQRDRQRERELAPVRQTLAREPYGSPAYQRALEDFRRMKQRMEAAEAEPEAEPEAEASRARAFTPEIAHVVRLGPIVGGAAVLPAAWLGGWANRRRRRIARRLAAGLRLVVGLFRGRAALVSVPWLVLGIAIVGLWVRSEIGIRDGLVYYARSPADRSCTWAALHSLDGAIAVSWRKEFYGTPWIYYLHDTTDPSSPGYTPGQPPFGLTYEAKHFDRTPDPRQRAASRAASRPLRGLAFVTSFVWRRGFSYYNRSGSPLPFGAPNTWGSYGWVGVPHWFLLALWSVPPLLVLRRRSRAARRAGLRLCPACGYDLRATPERCPECGAIPAALSTETNADRDDNGSRRGAAA